MKQVIYFFILMSLFCSCKEKERKTKEKSIFSFKIPEMDLNIITSKRIGAKFYVIFSKNNDITSISDSIDYIECETMDSNLNIIFDPTHKSDIYFWYPSIKKINQVKYNLCEIPDRDRYNRKNELIYRFFKKGITTMPDTLLKPYIHLSIIPSTYTIILNHDSKNQEWIKEGDIYGGW